MNKQKLNGKDLINVGIYTAINFVIVASVAMLGLIPVMLPMLCIICPLVSGIPMMLLYTKVRKFGMIWISTIILGFLMWLTGMGIYPVISGILFGLVGDIIYTKSNFKSGRMAVLSFAVAGSYIWANFIELYFSPATYMAARADFSAEYWETLFMVMPTWSCPVLLVVTFVCGILGAMLGKKLLKKHFKKAGIV